MRVLNVMAGLSLAAILAGCDGAVGPGARKLLLAADAAYQRGEDGDAIRAASRFLKMHPRVEEAGEAHYVRGLARIRAGQTEAGRADLAAALKFTRREDLLALAHAKLGEMAYDAGDMRQAENHYRCTLRHGPPGAPPADEAMYRLGCILQRTGRWPEADLFLDRVIYLFDGSELCRRARHRVHARSWSIQAGAFVGLDAARRLRDRLGRASLPARIDRQPLDGRLIHLVRVGSYGTYETARADLRKVRKIRPDAFVSPAR